MARTETPVVPARMDGIHLLSIEKAAKLVGVSRRTLEEWLAVHPVKVVWVGKNQRRLPYMELRRLIIKLMESSHDTAERMVA